MHTSFNFVHGTVHLPGSQFYQMPECHRCKPGFTLREGHCEAPLPAPQFVQGFGHLPGGGSLKRNGSLSFGLPTEPGQPLFVFKALSRRQAAEQGPISFSLADTSTPFSMDKSGVLRAPETPTFPAIIPITVVATEEVADCATFQDGTRSCETKLTISLIAVGYDGCPSDLYYYTSDLDVSVKADWAAPDLLPATDFDIGNSDSHSPGQWLGVGVVNVSYVSGALDVGVAVCEFIVAIVAGQEVAIPRVGELRTASHLVYFLIDSVGLTGALRDTAALFLDVNQASTSVGYSIAGNQPFIAEIPPGTTAELTIDMTWCRSRASHADMGQDESLSAGTSSTRLVGSGSAPAAAAAEAIRFSDDSSGFSADGGCFVYRAVSESMGPGMVSFKAIATSFQVSAANKNASASFHYYTLQSGSSIFLRYSSPAAAAVAGMEDFQPPTWVSCPKEPVRGVAPPSSNGARVVWTAPLAVDQGGQVTTWSTHSPGDFFTIEASPHTVTYTAEDSGGLRATCLVTVIVDYTTLANAFAGLMEDSFEGHVDVNEILGLSSYTQFIAQKQGPSNTFPPEVSSLTVDLVGLNSITATLSLAQGLALLRPEQKALTTVLEVDMTWAAAGFEGMLTGLAGGPAVQVKPTFTFEGLVQNSSGASGSSCCSPEANQFASVSADITSDGQMIRVSGVSHPIRTALRFSGLTVTLDFPANANFSGAEKGPGLRSFQLEDGSSIHVTSFFNLPPDTDPAMVAAPAFDHLVRVDSEPPVLAGCPGNMHIPALRGKPYAVASWASPLATDNLGVVGTSATHQSGSRFYVRELGASPLPVVLSAWDRFGNVAECVFDIFVEDTEDPWVRCPPPLHRTLAPGASTEVISQATWSNIVAGDNSPWPPVISSPVLQDFAFGTGQHSVSCACYYACCFPRLSNGKCLASSY